MGEQGGQIEVIEVDGGARPAWVVIIPGTQLDGPPEGANPFDPAGVAEALGYNSASRVPPSGRRSGRPEPLPATCSSRSATARAGFMR